MSPKEEPSEDWTPVTEMMPSRVSASVSPTNPSTPSADGNNDWNERRAGCLASPADAAEEEMRRGKIAEKGNFMVFSVSDRFCEFVLVLGVR